MPSIRISVCDVVAFSSFGYLTRLLHSFNASDPAHFYADNHKTLNQMLYPEMTARLQTETTSSSRQLSATASISGFVLDLDPSITTYVFAVTDAYRLGRQRVERLAAMLPKTIAESDREDHNDARISPAREEAAVASDVRASLEFGSGLVRMHPSELSTTWYPRPTQQLEAEQFLLPKLSVLAEYHTLPTERLNRRFGEHRSPILVFESTVHSSNNTLRPTLLSFATGVVHNIEERMKTSSDDSLLPFLGERPTALSPTAESHEAASARTITDTAPTDLQLFISLRIDKSRLDLTCKPDANVVAGLNWDNGGLILNTSPNAKGVSISASIEGLDVSLKHGFLSENSANIDARNINFSINF